MAAQRYLLLGDWSSTIEGMTRRMPMFGTRHRLLFASLVRIAGSIGGGCPRYVPKGPRWGITSFTPLIGGAQPYCALILQDATVPFLVQGQTKPTPLR